MRKLISVLILAVAAIGLSSCIQRPDYRFMQTLIINNQSSHTIGFSISSEEHATLAPGESFKKSFDDLCEERPKEDIMRDYMQNYLNRISAAFEIDGKSYILDPIEGIHKYTFFSSKDGIIDRGSGSTYTYNVTDAMIEKMLEQAVEHRVHQ